MTKARPQLSLAAGVAGNGDLRTASSPGPVSGGIETPGEPTPDDDPAIQRTGELAAKAVYLPKMWKDFSVTTKPATLMTANEAASVTGVPLRQVHRIIDAGLLGAAVKRRNKARLLAPRGLVGLRLAHETADVLTLQGRRAVVATSIRSPRQSLIRADMIVVDARPAAQTVRSGLSLLAKARSMVSSTPEVLGGTPVFKGTRIPVHDVADMLVNGDRPAAIIKAYPQLDADHVRLALIYAQAYPARGRPRIKPRRLRIPKASEMLAFDDLGRA